MTTTRRRRCGLLLALVAVCLAPSTLGAEVSPLLLQSRVPTELVAITSSTATVLIQKAAELYKIIRPEIKIEAYEPQPTATQTSTGVRMHGATMFWRFFSVRSSLECGS
jgi:hypothetical protein